MKQSLKIYATVLVALLIGGTFFLFNEMSHRQSINRITLLGALAEMEKLDKELEGEILQSSFFLYHNYDRIHAVLGRIEAKLEEVKRRHDEVYTGSHPGWTEMIGRYQAAFARRQAEVMLFLTANSTIKNSAMYIPVLVRRYSALTSDDGDLQYLDRLSSIASTVSIAKNGLDQELVTTLAAAIPPLQRHSPAEPKIEALHRTFVSHLQVFVDYFPQYAKSLTAILSPTTTDLLLELRRHITKDDQGWHARLNLISLIFLAAFLASIGLIVVLLVKTDRENLKLIELQKALTAAATTDQLTGLANRFAFDTDAERCQRPLLALVNIDGFKHINDLYGVRAGDFVLCAVADRLRASLPLAATSRLYRLGGDDFGILTDEGGTDEPERLASELLAAIADHSFAYEGQKIIVTISIGISNQRPLLETADMALKEVKKQKRRKYLVYSDDLHIQAAIAANLKTLTTIRHALENDGVLVYFQPIVDNHTDAIVKYECLIRLRDENGAILPPAAFLDIAKESPLYPALTMEVLAKSFEVFRDNQCEFSVNLSVTDILDPSVHAGIMARLDREPDLARRLTFEILESEGVDNYEAVRAFIRQIKERGCHIAVDDFGAGYSNFAHILRLQVDTLKIDASLIKQLDTDTNAQTLVRTIVSFCRTLNIQTVAEFVHSDPVHQMVRALGIDCSQGYLLGQPRPELPDAAAKSTAPS